MGTPHTKARVDSAHKLEDSTPEELAMLTRLAAPAAGGRRLSVNCNHPIGPLDSHDER